MTCSISIKKPSGAKKETQDIFNPFDVSQPSTNNKQQQQQSIGDINDIFGSKPSGSEIKTSGQGTNTSANSNNLIGNILSYSVNSSIHRFHLIHKQSK